jgi:hypothetical protein
MLATGRPSGSDSDHRWVEEARLQALFINTVLPRPHPPPHQRPIRLKIPGMAKKTGMSDSSLWLLTVALIAVSAWMFFRH